MPELEVFYDHRCPYCYRGLACLMRLLADYPQAEITWRPVEAHPKAEEPHHKPHADLVVKGAFYVRDHGKDIARYNEHAFDMYYKRHRKIDDAQELASAIAPLGIDTNGFLAALEDGTYDKELAEANEYAYLKKKVWAVPTFVFGDKRLDAKEGVGVAEEQIAAFLRDCYA